MTSTATAKAGKIWYFINFNLIIYNPWNGLETQAKALMTSVIRPDMLYFGNPVTSL